MSILGSETAGELGRVTIETEWLAKWSRKLARKDGKQRGAADWQSKAINKG